MFEALMAGGSILSGLMGADAASDAAAGQERAAGMATEEQRRQFDLLRQDNAPFLQTGQLANIKLRELLGLGGSGGQSQSIEQIMEGLRNSGRFATSGAQNLERGRAVNHDEFGRPDLFMFSDGSEGKDEYAMRGSPGVDEAALRAEAERIFGQQAQGQPGSVGELMRNFTGEDLVNEPGFKFGLDQGNKAIENAARARGMSMSPATVKELLRYGQDYAGTKYGDAFNRDLSNRTTKYNFLTGTSGGGQQAAQTVGSAGMNMAGNVGNLITGAANARGAAGIAGANALSGGINNAANMWNQKNILDKILNGGGGMSSTPYAGGFGWGNT